jgi:hypothetical protein
LVGARPVPSEWTVEVDSDADAAVLQHRLCGGDATGGVTERADPGHVEPLTAECGEDEPDVGDAHG